MKILYTLAGGMLVDYGMLIWYWDIAHGSKLLNLESFYPCQPVDLNASMKKDTWMDQNNEAMAKCVSTTDTLHAFLNFGNIQYDSRLHQLLTNHGEALIRGIGYWSEYLKAQSLNWTNAQDAHVE